MSDENPALRPRRLVQVTGRFAPIRSFLKEGVGGNFFAKKFPPKSFFTVWRGRGLVFGRGFPPSLG